MAGLIWAIIALLVLAWALGFAINIGWWINVLLLLALVGLIFNLFIAPFLAARARPTVVDEHVHRTHIDEY